MQKSSRLLVLVCACLMLATASQVAASEWPHLRGPDFDGRVPAAEGFDRETVGLELAWSASLGSGYSGVAVADGRAVTFYSDGDGDFAAAFDAETGERLWRYRIDAVHKGHDGSDDGPLSSPVISDGVAYGLGPRGQLFALRMSDGKELWKKTLERDFGSQVPSFGFTTTPLVEGDVLIVQTGGDDGRAISGIDKKSGKLKWSRGDGKVDYQSPSVLPLGGRRQLVAVSGNRIHGLEPATGEPLWEHELGEEDSAGTASPVYAGEDRFLVTISGAVAVFEVGKSLDGFEVEELFRSRELGGTYALPVYHDGHLYGFRGQFLTCIDAEKGERVWKSRPPGGRGLILVDGHLVIFGAEGNVVVAAATPEGYVEKGRLKALDGSGYTWPSFARGKVYVRNLERLAAVAVAGDATVARASGAAAGSGAADHEFGRFIRSLADAPDRQARVEQFMQAQDRFPIVEGSLVHIVYRGDVKDLAVAGTMIESGLPVPMERVADTDLFHKTFPLDPGGRYEYQFNVDFDERVPDPLNPRTVPGRFGDQKMSEVVMPGYEEPLHLREPDAARRGTLETIDFKSAALDNQREVTVYLPPGYADGDRKYPLLIVHQGKDWLERGLLPNTLDNLIGDRVSPVVVAFVPPIQQWWLEGGGSGTDGFVRMLAEEFVPFLESKYRLIPDPRARAVMGTTYFGVTAAYAALKYPRVFGNVAIQSVAMGLGSDQALMTLLETVKPSDVRFYVDWNRFEARNVDTSIDLREDALALAAALERNGFSYAGGEALDSHGWGGWRARTDRILEAFFPAN